jgi:hypothetical protein
VLRAPFASDREGGKVVHGVDLSIGQWRRDNKRPCGGASSWVVAPLIAGVLDGLAVTGLSSCGMLTQ